MKPSSNLKKFCALSLLAQAGLSPLAHAANDEECVKNPNRINMVFQLTSTGQEKVAKIAFEASRREIDTDLKLIPPSPPAFGSDPEACKRPNVTRLSSQEFSDKCFGFVPEAIWDGSRKGASMDRLEPVQLKMDGFKIRHLAFNEKPKVTCRKNVCEIDAKVDQFNVAFDIAARSVNESCDQLALKNVALSLDPKSTSAPTSVHMRFKYTNNLARPIEVDWDATKVNLPATSLQYKGSSVTDSPNLCHKNTNIQRLASEIVGDLVARNQIVLDTIMNTVKTAVLKDFTIQQIEELARMNGLGKEKSLGAGVPNFTTMTQMEVMSSAANQQDEAAKQYLSLIRSAKSANDVKKAHDVSKLIPKIKDFMSSFRSLATPKSANITESVAETWKATSDSLAQIASETKNPDMRSLIQRDADQINIAVSHLQNFQRTLQVNLRDPNDDQKLALVVTALQANDLQGEIEAKVSACYKCRTGNSRGFSPEWGFDQVPHDLAFKAGYDSLNQTLALMHAQNALNMCFVIDAKRDCKDARPSDAKVEVTFGNAPEVFWDMTSNSFAIRATKVKLKNYGGDLGKIAKTMEGDLTLPAKVTLSDDGKTIHFTPIEDKIAIANPYFTHADWDRTALISGAIAWMAEKAVNHIGTVEKYTQSKIANLATTDISVPEGATLTALTPGPAGFSIYLNLPEDPSAWLPEPQSEKIQGRQIATNKKLN